MKWLRWIIMMLIIALLANCGSDVEMDSNLPDPPPPPGQNPPSPQDADNDGVADADDQCPDTPAGENVDANGCADSQKDSDGDGVNDADDQCPETPAGTTVDENGCEEGNDDGDGDGVPNDDDECPNTPEGEEVDENGCASSQADSDGDGIADPNDDCPDTPEGEAVDESGCADSQKDSDSDGVSDADDQCPNTPEGTDVDENGCEEGNDDGDGDGVPNDDDDCPNTPEGEEVDENGCSASQLDADGDGVPDEDDACPDTPEGEEVNEEGCSESQADDTPPVVTSFEVTEITPTSFKVQWNLNESSKGYIRFGTASGTYDKQTAIENDYLTTHAQTVGGTNPEPLQPNTTYYWQIYVEDEAGNTGFSEEQTTTTVTDDDTPPEVTSIDVSNITPTSFQVEWNLDEGSKGYIRFGTSSGTYDKQTATEEDYLTRHVQTVGGTNPEPLQPNTTYYWQIYVEDEAGNTGFSEEQSTTTAEEVQGERTYVPDDTFEAILIHKGYDDVMDDYVLTTNIENITGLSLNPEILIDEEELAGDPLYFPPSELGNTDGFPIQDLTGLEDFKSLQSLGLRYVGLQTFSIKDFPNLINLRSLAIIRSDFPTTLEIINLEYLESITFFGVRSQLCDISGNANLIDINLYAGYFGGNLHNTPGNDFGKLIISNNQSLKQFPKDGDAEYFSMTSVAFLEFSNNPNLMEIDLDAHSYGAGAGNIVINQCGALQKLRFFGVGSNLEMTNLPNLTQLFLAYSFISTIDFSGLTGLTNLQLTHTDLDAIDVSGLTGLTNLRLTDNDLEAIDVSNLNALEIFDIRENPLTCIKVNQDQLNNIPASWTKDPEDTYSLDCN